MLKLTKLEGVEIENLSESVYGIGDIGINSSKEDVTELIKETFQQAKSNSLLLEKEPSLNNQDSLDIKSITNSGKSLANLDTNYR